MTEKTPDFDVVALAARPDLDDQRTQIVNAAWPEFMLHDPVLDRNWWALDECFPAYQFALLDRDDILGLANTVPLHFSGPLTDLPDRGVDWGMEKAVLDHHEGAAPNCLMGIQAVVNPAHRAKRLSGALVAQMVALAARMDIRTVILPVRPNQKAQFPLIPMERYVAWTNDAGLPYDAWLRVHARMGGRIIRVCPDSMLIPGTVADWSRWTGLEFPGTGRYCVPGALNPIDIDLEQDQGVYREPNVWVVHDVGG